MSRLALLDPNYKPPYDADLEAQSLLKKLQQALPNKEILLEAYFFGSASVGKQTSDSDLDLLLVIDDRVDVKSIYKIVGLPFFSKIAVDWIIKNKTDFDKNKELGGVCRVAALTGKRII